MSKDYTGDILLVLVALGLCGAGLWIWRLWELAGAAIHYLNK